MKALTTILLFSVYLLGTTEACQLLKIPFLLSHYLEHKENLHSSNSFLEYLAMHYDGENQHSKEHEGEEDRLPFKTVDDCCISGHTTLPAAGINFQPIMYSLNTPFLSVRNLDNYLYSYTGDIFQPPRI